ncbi:hypothetical protein [Duganella radicis]|uniref:Type III secretion system chaperone n=1 Tax=Duganella radicis TaxID=551988 RepID=A0A6L6PQM0_9BURK|nr:hypothetical protein [Duganella radicis]MTV41099.1 hypothetical protein [Duganella radicis]
MQIDELERQLQGFPLEEPVSIDGESVYLRVGRDGAELGAVFLEEMNERQLQEALQLGFQSALEFDAGWALSDDGASLLLTQWLPDARDWTAAPEALERLLNQVELLRALAASAPAEDSREHDAGGREEQRMRSKLMREK